MCHRKSFKQVFHIAKKKKKLEAHTCIRIGRGVGNNGLNRKKGFIYQKQHLGDPTQVDIAVHNYEVQGCSLGQELLRYVIAG